MSIMLIILVVALVLYVIAAFIPRLRVNIDMTAIGLALICATILVSGGTLA